MEIKCVVRGHPSRKELEKAAVEFIQQKEKAPK
jgi:hypothetical protein